MNAALSEVGYTCYVDSSPPIPGLRGHGGCEWPPELDPAGEFGFVSVILFDSELERLRNLVFNFGFCLDIPDAPLELPYAYGPEWAVDPQMCAVPAGGMDQMAEVLGGESNVADLTAYERIGLENPMEDWTADELKDFLGESG